MSSLASINDGAEPEVTGSVVESDRIQLRDYTSFVLRAIDRQGLSIRKLSTKTNIKRRRLSEILRPSPTPALKGGMTLVEFQVILRALDIEVMDAVIGVESLAGHGVIEDRRFTSMLQMISEVFSGLPGLMVEALNEIDGLDGTEIRREWAFPIRKAVVEKVVKEVVAKIQRRADFEL